MLVTPLIVRLPLLLLVVGCSGGDEQMRLAPATMHESAWDSTELTLTGLQPATYLQRVDGPLRVAGGLIVTIGDVQATVLRASGTSIVVAPSERLPVGAYSVMLVTSRSTHVATPVLDVYGGAVDSGVADADVGVVDSATDTGVGPTWLVVETMTVPCTTPTAQRSSTVLDSAGSWRLRASGTCTTDTALGRESDADFFDFPASPTDALSTIDPAIGIDDPTVDAATSPDWGPYDDSHRYEIGFSGADATISVGYHDGNYDNNTGELTLEILELR